MCWQKLVLLESSRLFAAHNGTFREGRTNGRTNAQTYCPLGYHRFNSVGTVLNYIHLQLFNRLLDLFTNYICTWEVMKCDTVTVGGDLGKSTHARNHLQNIAFDILWYRQILVHYAIAILVIVLYWHLSCVDGDKILVHYAIAWLSDSAEQPFVVCNWWWFSSFSIIN